MKQALILGSIYAVFFTYTVSMLIFGTSGMSSLGRLTEENRSLAANLDALNRKRDDLIEMLGALRGDPGAIAVEARSLGLYRPDEQVLRFQNFEFVKSLPDAGAVLLLDSVSKGREGLFRFISATVGAAVLLIGFISWRMRIAHTPKRE